MKYYYGNSYKDALNNNPVNITNKNILQAYYDNYACVFPAEDEWDEQYYQTVYKYKDDDTEYVDEYDDWTECEQVYNSLVKDSNCLYAVMRQINVYGQEEEIEVVNEYWNE